MKNYLSIIILTCASILMQAQTSSGKHHIKYLEINTGNSDYSVDFIKDKVVFAAATSDKVSSNSKYQPHIDLFVGDMGSEGEILNKTRNRGIVTKRITKTGATFTKDGKTVYFSAKKYSKRKATKSKLFKATIDSLGNWINVERLSINKKNYSIEHPSLNEDETKLYVSANLPSTLGGKDIFVIDINTNGTLSEPKNIGNKINTIKDEITPFIADNNFMYFSSNGHNDIDNFDIYASEIFENTVSDPLHLDSPINSINNDFAYIVNPETSKGYFSSNRLQGQSNNDIYSFYIEPDKPKECLQQIVGTVRDKETENLIVDATISILDEEGNEIKTLKTDDKGNYRFELSCRNTYTVVATKQEYSKEEHIVNTASYFDPPPLEINQGLTKELKKVDEKVVININPIYFGFDKSYIRNKAKVELDRIVEVMQENPDLIIESASHTDSRGSKAYNQKLSERRAKATVDYIVSKGIDRARITAKGYGESQLMNNCESGIPCSNDLHQLNRRTEFIVINKQVYYKSKEPPKKEEVRVAYETATNEEIKFSEKNLIKEIKNTTPVEENVSETTILNTSIVVVDNQEYEKISSIENKEEIEQTDDDNNVDDLEQRSKKDIVNSYQTNQPTNNIKKYEEEASTDASSSLNETTIENGVQFNSINSTLNADELIAGISENFIETANNLSSTITANNTNSVDLTAISVVTDDSVKEPIDKPINKIRDIKKNPLTISDLKETDIILDEENNTIANFNKDLTNKKDNISSASNTLFNEGEDDLYAANYENVNNNDLTTSKLTSTNTINKKKYTNEKEYKIEQFKEQYILSTKDLNKNEVLALNSINVSPISIKNNGKYIVTSNAKKVDVMRINFQINNNEYITSGHKEVYVLIQNPQGTILNRKGKFKVLNIGELTYTEKTNAYYNNDELNISMVTDRFIQKIIKGVYTILIYIEGYPVGLEMVELS